jgi:hypothetical protein
MRDEGLETTAIDCQVISVVLAGGKLPPENFRRYRVQTAF